MKILSFAWENVTIWGKHISGVHHKRYYSSRERVNIAKTSTSTASSVEKDFKLHFAP